MPRTIIAFIHETALNTISCEEIRRKMILFMSEETKTKTKEKSH